MARTLPLVLASALTCAVHAAGCSQFDREDRIEDLRVLAIKTEPAEILYSPLFLTPAAQRPPGFPLETTDVEVEVFAFDPRGGRVRSSIQLCPEGGSDSSCRLYDVDADLTAEPAAAREELKALLTPTVDDELVGPQAAPLGRIEPSRHRFSFTPPVIDFFIPDDADGSPVPSVFSLFPRFVFEARNLDALNGEVFRERAFKRIPVTLDLTSPVLPPEVVADFARSLGVELCTVPIPAEEHDLQEQASCLAPRVANKNPALEGFLLEPDPASLSPGMLTSDVTLPDLGLGSLLAVDAGGTVSLAPVFGVGADERYQIVSFDVETSTLLLLNRREDLACTWYSTRGDVSDTLTALEFGETLAINWQLPSEVESGERDSLVLVVLDQRGGTAVGEVTVEYR